MDRAEKRNLVSTLNEAWKNTGVIVVAHYKGMTVAQMTDYRKRVKEAGGQVKVAQDTRPLSNPSEGERCASGLRGLCFCERFGEPVQAS